MLNLKRIIKNFFRCKFFSLIIGLLISFYFLKLLIFKKKNILKIIVFSEFRWKESVSLLRKDRKIQILNIPEILFNGVNSLFDTNNKLKNINNTKRYWGRVAYLWYYLNIDNKNLEERKKKKKFILNIAKIIRFFTKTDCALTCAIGYNEEQEWASGFHEGGIPFICLHKELSMVESHHIDFRIKHIRNIKQKFQGTSIGVINDNVKKLFSKAELIRKNKIESIGMLKIQKFYNLKKIKKNNHIFTLFSFGHYSGNIIPKNFSSKLFCKNYNEGFSNLCFDTHKSFIESALKNRNITFYIKPKNYESWWIDEIEKIIKKVTGKESKDIKNLIITNKPSLWLIQNSINTIAFNSTVLLESVALGQKPIVPIFDEAKTIYKKHIFLNQRFKKYFFIAKSSSNLLMTINNCIKKKSDKNFNYTNSSKDFFKYYLTVTPNRCKEITMKFIKKSISEYKKEFFFNKNF